MRNLLAQQIARAPDLVPAVRAALTAARAEAAAMDGDAQAEALRTIGALRDLLE